MRFDRSRPLSWYPIPSASWILLLVAGCVSGIGLLSGCDLVGQSDLVTLEVRTAPGNAGITSPPSRTFNSGESVTLRAIPGPDTEYLFHRWSGDLESGENPIHFTIEENMTLVAHFTPRPRTLTITIQGEGTVEHRQAHTDHDFSSNLVGSYANGQQIELLATPDPGWEFVQWRGENFTFNRPANPEIMNIFKDQQVTAIFREAGS
ncbi:MAG: hypothetical protein WEA36_00910 [Balneolaceae bacterium]